MRTDVGCSFVTLLLALGAVDLLPVRETAQKVLWRYRGGKMLRCMAAWLAVGVEVVWMSEHNDQQVGAA